MYFMKILFCGTMVPDNVEYQTKGISAAGSRFQNNMIKNMRELGHEIYQCSFLAVPITSKIRTSLENEVKIEDNKVQYIFKERNVVASVIKYYKSVLKVIKNVDIIICYNIVYAWLLLPYLAKCKRKKGIAIIADYSDSISYKGIISKLYAKFQLWSMRRFDTVVGLSANIRSKLKKKQKFILMEGGIDQAFYDAFSYQARRQPSPYILMYSGLLSQVTGVDLLLEVMQRVSRQDIKLVITGKGPLEKEVRKASMVDTRICYKGHLTYEEYMEQLQNADVLINPRNMNIPENQNNFPSKIMEYLATGKVILSTRFVGWEKFEENIIFCESSVDGIKRGIEIIIRKWGDRELYYMLNREKAKQFEWKEQIRKVLGNT